MRWDGQEITWKDPQIYERVILKWILKEDDVRIYGLIYLNRDRDQKQTLVNTVRNLQVLLKAGNFSIS
jgi:hypothetical protein